MYPDDEAQQEAEWTTLYRSITATLRQFGVENAYGEGDYWVLDENWGVRQQKIEFHQLRMLSPPIIEALQRDLVPHPDWEIVVGLDVPGKEDVWPPMGLIVRPSEVVDKLRREYLPPDHQALKYEGGRLAAVWE